MKFFLKTLLIIILLASIFPVVAGFITYSVGKGFRTGIETGLLFDAVALFVIGAIWWAYELIESL